MPNKTKKTPKTTRKQRKAAENSSEDYNGISTTDANVAVQYLENPVQSDADKNQYRVIKLHNGITVTLISCFDAYSQLDGKVRKKDAENGEKEEPRQTAHSKKEDTLDWFGVQIDKSKKNWPFCTCCLSINVGSFSDPPDAPNLSCLLSKAVLNSSKKYPQSYGLCDFLQKNAANSLKIHGNLEDTTFVFHVPVIHACDAIDRFTSYFVQPILRREVLSKENECVQREDDNHRVEHLLLADPRRRLFHNMAMNSKTHPFYAKKKCYSVRTRTNESEMYEEANKFMENHYSAHRMTVVLMGQVPLDSLEQCARKYFARIPNNGLPQVRTSSPYDRCFDMRDFNLLYVNHSPLPGKSKIVLDWIVPPIQDHYRVKPHGYISKLLQNEMSGSLLYYLSRKLWCCGIESGVENTAFENNSIYSIFNLSLTLTEEGVKHQKEILDVVYSYVNFLKLGGTQKRVYDEIRKIEKVLFRIKSDYNAEELCEELCRSMHFYPSQDYLTGNVLYYDYDPKTITMFLDCLSPERANIKLDSSYLTHSNHSMDPCDITHGFTRTKIPQDWINEWTKMSPLPCFELPEPNPFCPDDFTIVRAPKNSPRFPIKIHSDSLCEIWHKLDDTCRGPMAMSYLYIINDSLVNSAENSAMLVLFCHFLEQSLHVILYPATVVGMKFAFRALSRGIEVQVTGFRQMLPILMGIIAQYIGESSHVLTEDILNSVKSTAIKGWWAVCKIFSMRAEDVLCSILLPVHWTHVEMLRATAEITFEKFVNFAEHFTDHVYVRSLVQGNIGASEAVEMVKIFLELANCGPVESNAKSQMETNTIPRLPRGSHRCKVQNLHPWLDVTRVLTFYQFGERSVITSAGVAVLMMILNNPIFEIVRTRYNISRFNVEIDRDCSFTGYMLSAQVHGIDPRVELGIEKFRCIISKMLKHVPRGEWEVIKKTYCQLQRQADYVLEDEMGRYWAEITSGQFIMDRHVRETEIIDRLDLDDLQTLLISLTTNGLNVRKLSVQIVGHTEYTDKESKSSDEYIPPMDQINLKVLTDAPEQQEEADGCCITDIAAFKQTCHRLMQNP